MDKYAIYDAWAPADSVWSAWVKPAPFAHLPRLLPDPSPSPPYDLGWLRRSGDRPAIVADLPGPNAIYFALCAAKLGWQPVSLINACPPMWSGNLSGMPPAVDVSMLLAVLAAAAPELAAFQRQADSPPVFFVDANRQAPGRPILPQMFDNRSVLFGSDFPSARALTTRGIRQVLVVRDPLLPPGRDLAHALAPWRKDGIEIGLFAVDGAPIRDPLPATGWLAEMWFHLSMVGVLRRNPLGGYGAFVPESSGG